MKAVFDTSSLVKLQKGNCLDLIGKLFDIVFIPKAVRDEFTGSLDPSVVRIQDVTTELPIGLGQGERQAISLAKEKRIPWIVVDDKKAITRAIQQGLRPQSTLQLLHTAKERGHIPSVKSVLDTMKENGEGIDDDVYTDALRKAGELYP